MTIETDDIYQELGFADTKEFHRLVSSADISTPDKLARFKQWQEHDGSKAGLLGLRDQAVATLKEHIISSSYGNDSIAMIQWAVENKIPNVSVVFVDTGWAKPGWLDRVASMEEWVRRIGFNAVHLKPPIQFEELMRMKKGFPDQRLQWCSGILKGLPFLTWIDEIDPERKALVLIGKRREESLERADTPEFIDASIYHGGRLVWHPLYLHEEAQRDELIIRAGFEVLPHRSKECSPCINANKKDLRHLTEFEIDRVEALEADTGQTMFRTKKKGGAKGIRQVIQWANSGRGKYNPKQENLFTSCSSGYCGY